MDSEPRRTSSFKWPGTGVARCTSALFAKRADVHRATPVPGHLNDDVRRGSESIEPQALAGLHPAEPQGAVADDARTEQWRRFLVTKDVGNRVGVVRRYHGVFRIASVHVVPGKARLK